MIVLFVPYGKRWRTLGKVCRAILGLALLAQSIVWLLQGINHE